MLGCFIRMASLEHFTRQGNDYLGLFTLAFLGFLAVLFFARKLEIPILWIILIAVLFRLPLLFTEPTLSSDVWRYLWDGRLVTHGVSPYAHRIDSPELADLRTDLHSRIDHQWMASPYPPAAQVVFAAVYGLVPESPTAMQIIFTLFDLANIWLIAELLKHYGHPPKWSLIYAWHPLMVVEFAHGAHVDSLMTLLILAALLASLRGRQNGSGVILGLSTLTKFIPALLLPVFLRRWGWRGSLLYGGLVVLAFLPFIMMDGLSHEGTGVFGAASVYAQQWKTNDGLFYWLVEFLSSYVNDPIRIGRLISNTILLAIGGIIFFKPRLDPIIAAAVLISVYLLFAFAMFPWYLTWLIALLPLLKWDRDWSAWIFVAAWLYFSWAVNLSYLFYLDLTKPGEIMWIRYAEYLPLYGGLLLSAVLYGVKLLKRLPEGQAQHGKTTEGE